MNAEDTIVPYLRGLIAAEGGVGLNKIGGVSHLLIGSTKEKDKKFYKGCLKILGIRSKEYDQRIEICGGENFKRFLELDLFRLHPERKLKFLSALNLMKRIKKKYKEISGIRYAPIRTK